MTTGSLKTSPLTGYSTPTDASPGPSQPGSPTASNLLPFDPPLDTEFSPEDDMPGIDTLLHIVGNRNSGQSANSDVPALRADFLAESIYDASDRNVSYCYFRQDSYEVFQ